jgi:hypothetical protein
MGEWNHSDSKRTGFTTYMVEKTGLPAAISSKFFYYWQRELCDGGHPSTFQRR